MKNTLLVLVGVAVLAVGGYFAMKSKTQPEPVTTSMPIPETTETVESTQSAEMIAVQTITMDAGSFYYSVKEINAKVGDKIKIVMTAKDMMHNFNIDELGIESDTIKAGETTTFEFIVGEAGTFEYYCSIGSHRKNGQVGKIIVN